MTIAIAVAVPDGIALAADTQTTWQKTITKAKEKGTGKEFELEESIKIPIGWSQMAKKLFRLTCSGICFAVCTAGEAMLSNKTMYAVFKSLEGSYAGEGDCKSVTEHLVTGLQDQLKQHHGTSDLSTAPSMLCPFIIAGFEETDVSKPFLQSHLVFSGKVTVDDKDDSSGHNLRFSNTGYAYGACWIGRAEYISHVVTHKNPALPPITGQYALMTLADAVDYSKFLVEFTCDFQRFAVMVPDCGRPMVSVTLTPQEYKERVVQ